METLGLSSAAAGLLSLGITVCQGLLDYYQSWKDAEDQVAHMYASMEALTETFRLLQSAIEPEVFSHASVQKVEDSIRSTENGLQSLRRKLEKICLAPSQPGWKAKGIAQFRKTLFPFKESTLAKLKERAVEMRQDLSLALEILHIESSVTSSQKLNAVVHGLRKVSFDVDILRERSILMSNNAQSLEASSQKISKSLGGLVAIQADEYCRKVHDWFSPLTVELQKKHLDTFNTYGRQDAAAQSLLESPEFKDWQTTIGETLWCPGIQGSGKTIFASYVINHLESIVNRKESRLAYFYLSYKDAEKQSVRNLLMSFVCQLALSEPVCTADLMASYEAHRSRGTSPSHVECTSMLRSVVSRCKKIFLIIDAFDEYPEVSRGRLLRELRSLEPRANVLITSRNLPTIGRQLSKAVRLDIQARRDDILQYLRERIVSSETLKSHINRDSTLSNLISTTIADKAEGMFLQARLNLDFLTTKTTLRKLKNALTTLPEGLNSTYDEAMERINSQHPDQAVLAKRTISWVLHAYRPLTMREIQHALAVEVGDSNLDEDNIPEEGLLLSVCNGLVTYEKEGGCLNLVHYTFQQYLEQRAESFFPEAHVEIVQACLTYLSFDEFEQGPCSDYTECCVRLERRPLLSYAVPGWNLHISRGVEEACGGLINSFLSQDAKLSAYVQILWAKSSTGSFLKHRFPLNVSALWLACFHGLEYTVSRLLASQMHTIDRQTTWGDTALHRAAACGNTVILELLLSNGANVNARDWAGNTPLHFAWAPAFWSITRQTLSWKEPELKASDMSLKAVRLLLDYGADVNGINILGRTVLHLSVSHRQKSLTQLLLARGSDVTIRDHYQSAPLTLASKVGAEEIAHILLKHDLQGQVQCGIPPDAMRLAAFNGQLSLLGGLLLNISEQTPPDREGRNLMHLSASGGSLKCLQFLENFDSKIEALDKRKRTVLHLAAAGGRPESCAVLEYLLQRGFDSNQRDVNGWTPLLWAAKAGNTATLKTLLERADSGLCQSGREWIPFAIATYQGNPRAAAILRPTNKPLPEVFQSPQSSISLRHPEIQCDGCELPIFGSRYNCSECPDFDYCFKCVLSADDTHPSHRFDFKYWDDRNQDVQKIDRQEIMEEVTRREDFMMSWRA